MDETKIACIFSVAPRPGQRKVSRKDDKGRHVYWNVSQSEVAIKGKCVLLAERDTFFGGAESREYRSGVLTNPTWGQVFREFRKSMLVTRDLHHCFLEGVFRHKEAVHGKLVEQFVGGIPIYRFSAGS